MTVDRRDGMFQHIHIQVSDTFGSVRAVWPDGTIHEHTLPKGVDAHRVAAVVADALSEHVYTGPGDRSTKPVSGAGVLQYENEILLSGFMITMGATISHDGSSFVLRNANGGIVAYGDTIHNLTINTGLRT